MAFQDYDFGKHQSISNTSAIALKRRFESWSDLANATADQLKEVPGIGNEQIDDLWDTAKAQLRLEARKTFKQERLVDRGIDSSEKLFVLSEKPADHIGGDGSGTVRNIKRRRKELTPAICPECGVDFAERKGIDWAKAGPVSRDEIIAIVAEHIEKQHDLATKRLLTKSQMDSIGA